jgi:hypothetical protein
VQEAPVARVTLVLEDREGQDEESSDLQVSLDGDCGNPFNPEVSKMMTPAQVMGWECLAYIKQQAPGFGIVAAGDSKYDEVPDSEELEEDDAVEDDFEVDELDEEDDLEDEDLEDEDFEDDDFKETDDGA